MFLLALYEQDTLNEVYEIVIGGWENTRSVIRNALQGGEEVDVETPDILSCNRYRNVAITICFAPYKCSLDTFQNFLVSLTTVIETFGYHGRMVG